MKNERAMLWAILVAQLVTVAVLVMFAVGLSIIIRDQADFNRKAMDVLTKDGAVNLENAQKLDRLLDR